MATPVQNEEPAITEFVRERIAARTKIPLEKIAISARLIDLGLQSIDAVLLCGEVEDRFSVELDPNTIFEHETLDGFIADIVARLNAR